LHFDRGGGQLSFRDAPKARARNPSGRPAMYYVYLLASRKNGTLYLGVTNDLIRRVHQHKSKTVPGFSSRYDVNRLVWFEAYDDPAIAIAREKDIKKWRRLWKVRLIDRANPAWNDLSEGLSN
jgi:putative endonuclease